MVKVYINDVTPGRLHRTIQGGVSRAKDTSFIALQCETTNPLIGATYLSFAEHLPLRLSPDVIFNVILQGIAEHISYSPEKYRSVFVARSGQNNLIARDDTLVRGSWDNIWDNSIQNLRMQILEDMSGE